MASPVQAEPKDPAPIYEPPTPSAHAESKGPTSTEAARGPETAASSSTHSERLAPPPTLRPPRLSANPPTKLEERGVLRNTGVPTDQAEAGVLSNTGIVESASVATPPPAPRPLAPRALFTEGTDDEAVDPGPGSTTATEVLPIWEPADMVTERPHLDDNGLASGHDTESVDSTQWDRTVAALRETAATDQRTAEPQSPPRINRALGAEARASTDSPSPTSPLSLRSVAPRSSRSSSSQAASDDLEERCL